METFNGKTAVITGAGSGFGREFARLGAQLGMSLVLADVQRDALEATASELEASGAPVTARCVDVSQGEQVEALADVAFAEFGTVHLLFNNAGVAGRGGLMWESGVKNWEWILGVNLWGVIHGVHAFTPRMIDAARQDPSYRGHIVNTASMSGLLNPPLMGPYNASKHAVVSLSETLYHDLALASAQVRCSVLCPSFVPTAITLSDRNRPTEYVDDVPLSASQRAAQAMTEDGVNSSRVSAEQVARMTFEAIRDDRFYIYSHPNRLAGIAARMSDLLEQRNPSDPLTGLPEVRAKLETAVRV
ncbi:SDR family oxidoreductase [Paraburkholderia youngii]|uniref:SDR family oxidoreductase n=1 Tax=Paraburkholderia youngii TaxID=2782701 RepID=UPI003D2618F9